MRGKKKPTPLKILHGDDKKNPQRINKNEPKAQCEAPDCPSHLKGHARRKWTHTVKVLSDMRIVSQAELTLLEAYCVTYGKWRAAVAIVDKEGPTAVNGQGGVIRNPADIAMCTYTSQLQKMGNELGLSYMARTKISAEPEEQDEGIKPRKRA